MSRLLRLALCSDNQELEGSVQLPEELHDDPVISEASDRMLATHSGEEASTALESLFDCKAILESFGGAPISKQTAEALTQIYGSALESLAPSNNGVALEGFTENLRNGFDDMFQAIVVSWKHHHDVFADFIGTVNSRLATYVTDLEKTSEEFQEKKSKFRDGKHHGSFAELWYFFTSKNGESKNLIHDLNFDTEASHYILNEYVKEVLSALVKTGSVIGKAKLSSERDASSFFEEIGKLPAIDDMFKSKYLGEGILYNVTTVELKRKPVGRVIEIGGKKLSGLAAVAAKSSVIETKSLAHSAWKVAGQTGIGQSIKLSQTTPFELTTEEIGKVIDFGKRYAQNIENYLKFKREVEIAFQDVQRSVEKLRQQINPDVPHVHEALKQVTDYVDNLMKAVTTPAVDEIKRSIKGAKYCNYLALRMIYNASKYF